MKITGNLDIYSVNELRSTLAEHLASGAEVALDLSEVEICDVAGLQLICSAHKTAAASGKPFVVTAASSQFIAASAEAGLSSRSCAWLPPE